MRGNSKVILITFSHYINLGLSKSGSYERPDKVKGFIKLKGNSQHLSQNIWIETREQGKQSTWSLHWLRNVSKEKSK
ncbi:hypothetical protein ACV3OB_15215 [Clostridium perfringens]|uniref:hypothetical protein n=1 Tax=Clostridium perfringens TaxID=1502 RepID=UPI0018E4D5B5|nr:hypothetical protein [Clostridium perfringens]MBI6068302.1 hypothetical protein [Clostridium perfringens]MBI6096957.1 hypothetical protein [Clostridium perfringens]